MEAQFRNARINIDETKYNHVVGALDPKYLQRVTDIVRNPPPNNKYEAIKQRLIHEFTDSDQRKLQRLIKEIELGDDKPSQLLKKMKDLAGSSITDEALKSLWIERLPESVRAVISIGDGDSAQWAKQADKMMEVTSFAQVSSIRTRDNDPLVVEIAQLRKEIAEIKMFNRSRDRTRSGDRRRYRSKSKQNHSLCFYHNRFVVKAKKCIEPCQFKSNLGDNSGN